MLALDARGWQRLLAVLLPTATPRLPLLLWLAMVREAISRLLPVAGVGGDVEGIRLLAKQGTPLPLAAASVVAETLITLFASALFVGLGLLLLPLAGGNTAALGSALFWLPAAALALPLGLFWALKQGAGFARLAGWLLRRLPGQRLVADAAALDAALAQVLRHSPALAAATAWQLAGMVLGAAEVWWALHLCGQPVTPAAALAIEALVLLLRNLVFFIPAALGVQEAGVLALGLALGFTAPAAAALALVKRARELLFSLPVLLIWQRRLL